MPCVARLSTASILSAFSRVLPSTSVTLPETPVSLVSTAPVCSLTYFLVAHPEIISMADKAETPRMVDCRLTVCMDFSLLIQCLDDADTNWRNISGHILDASGACVYTELA